MLTERFTFVCSPNERRLLAALSKRLNRSQGDTVRQLIKIAVADLGIDQTSEEELESKLHDRYKTKYP